MPNASNPKAVFKFAAYHTFSSAQKSTGPYFFIFADGSVGYGKTGFSLRPSAGKLNYQMTNESVAKVETTTAPAGKPQTTVKIIDVNGRTDIFRVTQIMSLRKDIVAAQLTSLLSTFFGDRYTKN